MLQYVLYGKYEEVVNILIRADTVGHQCWFMCAFRNWKVKHVFSLSFRLCLVWRVC